MYYELRLLANMAKTIASEKLRITPSPLTFPFLLHKRIPSKYPYKNKPIEVNKATTNATSFTRTNTTPPTTAFTRIYEEVSHYILAKL